MHWRCETRTGPEGAPRSQHPGRELWLWRYDGSRCNTNSIILRVESVGSSKKSRTESIHTQAYRSVGPASATVRLHVYRACASIVTGARQPLWAGKAVSTLVPFAQRSQSIPSFVCHVLRVRNASHTCSFLRVSIPRDLPSCAQIVPKAD